MGIYLKLAEIRTSAVNALDSLDSTCDGCSSCIVFSFVPLTISLSIVVSILVIFDSLR